MTEVCSISKPLCSKNEGGKNEVAKNTIQQIVAKTGITNQKEESLANGVLQGFFDIDCVILYNVALFRGLLYQLCTIRDFF